MMGINMCIHHKLDPATTGNPIHIQVIPLLVVHVILQDTTAIVEVRQAVADVTVEGIITVIAGVHQVVADVMVAEIITAIQVAVDIPIALVVILLTKGMVLGVHIVERVHLVVQARMY